VDRREVEGEDVALWKGVVSENGERERNLVDLGGRLSRKDERKGGGQKKGGREVSEGLKSWPTTKRQGVTLRAHCWGGVIREEKFRREGVRIAWRGPLDGLSLTKKYKGKRGKSRNNKGVLEIWGVISGRERISAGLRNW